MNYTDKKLQKELALALVSTSSKQKQADSNNFWFTMLFIVVGTVAYFVQ